MTLLITLINACMFFSPRGGSVSEVGRGRGWLTYILMPKQVSHVIHMINQL